MRRLTALWLALALCSIATPAQAACQVDAKPVAFGVVDVRQRSDSTGEVAVSCAIATPFKVAITGIGSPGNRYMTGPGNGRLSYELFTDPSFSTRWGDGSGAGQEVAAASDGESTKRLTIYGRVPEQNAVPAGGYSDSLTIELSFF
jgi:spore coat protein U-like protein